MKQRYGKKNAQDARKRIRKLNVFHSLRRKKKEKERERSEEKGGGAELQAGSKTLRNANNLRKTDNFF